MELIPAIDLRDGKCVRLYQGDFDRQTVYSDDPVEVALRWEASGAGRLHVVDLDGAREGAPANTAVVREIACAVSIPLQLGGGIRTVDTATEAVSMGVDRVIVGTAAVDSPDLVGELCRRLGPVAVVVGLDARDGYVALEGWTRGSRVLASELATRMAEVGAVRFMYTDVGRDGTLTEPNFQAVDALLGQVRGSLMVAGGISSQEQLLRLSRQGVEAAIVGQALYTGAIDLCNTLAALAKGP